MTRTLPEGHTSLIVAITTPARTNTTMSTCIQIQNGDTRRIVERGARR
jgi:hypothetical protein